MSIKTNSFYDAAFGVFVQKFSLWGLFLLSIIFFGLGLYFPIMKTEILLGLKNDFSYLTSAITHFFKEGDYFIASLIGLFCFIFPICKYIFVGLHLCEFNMGNFIFFQKLLEVISKWAMLDVFVVALIIVNMKFDSLLIKTQLAVGTTYFSVSILLLSICSHFLYKKRAEIQEYQQ